MKNFKNTMQKFLKSGKFWFAAGVVFLILVWWLIAAIINADYILPTPWQTLAALPKVITTPLFLSKVGVTLARTLTGFAIAFVLGAAAALLSIKKEVEGIIKPIVTFLRSVPTLVLTVLFLMWFSKDTGPMIIGIMMVFPVMYTGLSAALKNVSRNLLEMAAIYKVPKGKIYSEIYLKSILPYVFSTAESSLGMKFKVVVSAEVLMWPTLAIGKEIHYLQAKYFFNAEVFAWIIIVLAVTFLLEWLIGLLKKAFIKW